MKHETVDVTGVLQDIKFDEENVIKEAFVDFCIQSNILDANRLSLDLGISPSRAFSKGDKYQGKVRNVDTGQMDVRWNIRYTGIWAKDTKELVATKRIEQHIQYLLNILEPKRERIEKFLADVENYVVSFYIWWEPISGHGSYIITQDILSRMSALCHHVYFGTICVDDDA